MSVQKNKRLGERKVEIIADDASFEKQSTPERIVCSLVDRLVTLECGARPCVAFEMSGRR